MTHPPFGPMYMPSRWMAIPRRGALSVEAPWGGRWDSPPGSHMRVLEGPWLPCSMTCHRYRGVHG